MCYLTQNGAKNLRLGHKPSENLIRIWEVVIITKI